MTFIQLKFFVLIHCSVVVKTSDLSVWCLSLHWNEFKSHLIRSGNFVCVCFCLGGRIFCIRWESYNFFGKLLPTEFLQRCSMKLHVICASFKILKFFWTITMPELRMLEKLRLALKETYRCSTDKLPVLIWILFSENALIWQHVILSTKSNHQLLKVSQSPCFIEMPMLFLVEGHNSC